MAPIRVLHVIGQMNRGGAETWLMQVLRNVPRDRARLDFLVTRPEPGHYDPEIAALGAAVIPCELTRGAPARFARRFLEILRARGPYDVVHSHVHHFSGLVLALARAARVPIRIAHSHLDTQALDSEAGLRRRAYLGAMSALLRRSATRGLAVSEVAAAALFGERWKQDPRWEITRCGLDFSPFRAPRDAAAVRAELGLPPEALVLGHVGRLEPQKNHAFLVRLAAAAMRREPRARLVLVGDGPLRGEVEAAAIRLGIRERVALAGVRSDVPRLLGAMDVFVLPSIREGLPLVGLEAQAAGVPIVLSDAVTSEVVVIPELFTWLPLTAPPEAWADAALAAARAGARREGTASVLERSEFSLGPSIAALLGRYGLSAR